MVSVGRRSISVTSNIHVAKVFERIVYDQLYNVLINEIVISTNQSRSCSLHSTVTALLEATDNRALISIVVMLLWWFFSPKAFETVVNDILLSKMNLNEIQRTPLDWFLLLQSVHLNVGYHREQS